MTLDEFQTQGSAVIHQILMADWQSYRTLPLLEGQI